MWETAGETFSDYELIDLLIDSYYLNPNNYEIRDDIPQSGDLAEYFFARLPEEETGAYALPITGDPRETHGVNWIFAPEFDANSCTSGQTWPDGEPACIGTVLVPYVNPDSPAAAAGLSRGDIIFEVYIDEERVPLTTLRSVWFDEAVDPNQVYLESYFGGDPVSFFVQRASDNRQVRIDLGSATVHESYAFDQTVIEADGRRVGYLLINEPTLAIQAPLRSAVESFGGQAVNELVIDLRYAATGSPTVLSELAFMVADSARTPDAVYARLEFNQNKFGSCPVDPVTGESLAIPFPPLESELPTLNLSRVIVLTNEDLYFNDIYTCGAAEQFIINLKDLGFPTIVIGDGATCGNPYAGYEVDIGDYSFYLDMFINRGSNSSTAQGGIEPDCLVADDEYGASPLMSRGETLLEAALNYIATGRCSLP